MNHITDPVPADLETWEAIRDKIHNAAQHVMGPLPSGDRSGPPKWSVFDETDCGTYVRQSITYEADEGCETTAFICLPNDSSDEARPGVLCLHPTNGEQGYRDVVGLSGRVNRSYASELAEEGFVTISPSYPLMADYQPDIDALGYESGTMKAIWDNIRALDLLESFSCVAGRAFGAIGHSLGGHNSVYTAVFDPRIEAVVSNCGLDSYLDYLNWTPGNGWSQKRYMPRLVDYDSPAAIPFDFHDLIASLAPRGCLVSAPMGDSNFKWQSAAEVVRSAGEVYRLHGAADRLQIIHPQCPHDFPPDVRRVCYDFIGSVLR
ncbi:MAG: alpha/beta hydrolase [Gemmatimonadetes bacterium]|jgi:dienelactone hydrolase|nr:alpha/beta hydrolase [Gemmatimonadota bacterium]MBT5059898.1 alpha/beta hydrolase [Gemmatimonadota bacterium]MBT5141579.1 alpha/beta hydrolase [Gemmatimonadota bacterium]MBT5590882.1 alpha/beta hydrolase [Gemmatimonadota bacterium]MBT5965054.1 alpha/beta hydrolase [Gemmatimonadota bacterium]